MADNPSEPGESLPVHDEFVPEAEFAAFLDRMPQVCVELVVETADGILLAKRTNHPAVWFWPGGRLYKGERLEAAAHRIASEELDIEVDILDQIGPYAHFWDASDLDGASSRHTVNVVYHVTPANDDFDIELDDQHSDYRFVTRIEPELHEYVRRYLRDNDLL